LRTAVLKAEGKESCGICKPGRICRTCTKLGIASSHNTFPDEASAISLIASLNLFFLGSSISARYDFAIRVIQAF